MDLVVDANVLFAALIKEGLSYRLFFKANFHLFTSEYIFTEFEDHKGEILEKTGHTEGEFYRNENEYVNEAEAISPDPDDMVYFALALKLNCGIWSNDKKLKSQNKIPIYHTHELVKFE